MKLDKFDVSIITITYNEREVIGPFILTIENILKENGINGEIIVVDDSSPDGTSDIVFDYSKTYKNIRLIKRPEKMGIGSAYRDGILASNGDVIVTIDADLSHPPSSLIEMIEHAKQNKVVSGSRFLKKNLFNTSIHRKLGTTLLNYWIRLFLKPEIKDCTNGYIAVKKTLLDKIIKKARIIGINPFDKVLYGIPIFGVASYLNMPLVEVAAPYEFRKAGETKIKFLYGMRVFIQDIYDVIRMFFLLKLRGKRIKYC